MTATEDKVPCELLDVDNYASAAALLVAKSGALALTALPHEPALARAPLRAPGASSRALGSLEHFCAAGAAFHRLQTRVCPGRSLTGALWPRLGACWRVEMSGFRLEGRRCAAGSGLQVLPAARRRLLCAAACHSISVQFGGVDWTIPASTALGSLLPSQCMVLLTGLDPACRAALSTARQSAHRLAAGPAPACLAPAWLPRPLAPHVASPLQPTLGPELPIIPGRV